MNSAVGDLVLKLNLHFSVLVGPINNIQDSNKKTQTRGLLLSKPSQSTTCGTDGIPNLNYDQFATNVPITSLGRRKFKFHCLFFRITLID